jgi:hypothetical protein
MVDIMVNMMNMTLFLRMDNLVRRQTSRQKIIVMLYVFHGALILVPTFFFVEKIIHINNHNGSEL